jgi:hypothetical protein
LAEKFLPGTNALAYLGKASMTKKRALKHFHLETEELKSRSGIRRISYDILKIILKKKVFLTENAPAYCVRANLVMWHRYLNNDR